MSPVPPVVHVSGMTCVACERRIERKVRAIAGVQSVRASHRDGTVRVQASARVSLEAVGHAVRAAGYELVSGKRAWISRDGAVWRDVGIGAAVCLVFGLVAWLVGFGDLQAALGDAALGGSLVLVVLLGVAASISTCMALVGGLVLGVAGRYAAAHPDVGFGQRMRPHLAFHAGRVVGFGLLGALLGAVGSVFSASGRLLAILMIVVALVMAQLGLTMTGLAPGLAGRVSVTLPRGLAARWEALAASPRAGTPMAAGLGAASFFLPCGFTQAVQVFALGTGSPGRAALVMALFALGTVPGLLALAGVGAAGRGQRGVRLRRALGVVVIVFALVNIVGAVRTLAPGLGAGSSGPPPLAISQNVEVTDGVQVVTMTQDWSGYHPASIVVYAGLPIRWQVYSEGLSCASLIDGSSLGLGRVEFAYKDNTIDVPPLEAGTHTYRCLMGMYSGSFTAIEPEGQGESAG